MPTLLALSIGPDIPGDCGTHRVDRNPRCDVRLASCRVSRRHGIIAMERAEVVVPDLGSTHASAIASRRGLLGAPPAEAGGDPSHPAWRGADLPVCRTPGVAGLGGPQGRRPQVCREFRRLLSD